MKQAQWAPAGGSRDGGDKTEKTDAPSLLEKYRHPRVTEGLWFK